MVLHRRPFTATTRWSGPETGPAQRFHVSWVVRVLDAIRAAGVTRVAVPGVAQGR